MSMINSGTSISYIDNVIGSIYDNENSFNTYADLLASGQQVVERLYYIITTATYYRWDTNTSS